MAGRVQLVKSVIQGMLVHSFSIYSWPNNLINEMERWMRNFIWSGDVTQRKLVTVAWKKVCSSFNEGGLGIRSLSMLNQANNLKLCWDLIQSNLQWAHLLRSRVLNGSKPISYHVYSSIWSSIKHKFSEVMEQVSWQVAHLHQELNSTVSNFIINSKWAIPSCILNAYPQLQGLVDRVTIPFVAKEDSLYWMKSHDGN
ncbi:putative ribonuclease H protein, partial [Trifolium medium]|nr:putative ribonuclease H protein [Trifolium medium]